MKNKIKILACILALSVCCFGITVNAETITVDANEVGAAESVATVGDTAVTYGTPTTVITSGTVYNIVNAKSGKYLNVHMGYDENGINVYQWTADGSDEQQFKVVLDSATVAYKIYAMSSSNGNGRVVDVIRSSSGLVDGCNVDIWNPTDPDAQNWSIVHAGNGYFKIALASNTTLAMTAYGTENGTAGGTTSTSAGNVYVSTYDTLIGQLWTFEEVTSVTTPATPNGYLEQVYPSVRGWAWRSDIPNTPIDIHIYVRDAATGANIRVYVVTASNYRYDLVDAGIGNGYHGFEFNIDWNSIPYGTYNVSVYAIGYNANNPEITCSPISYTVTNTLGYMGYAVYRDLGFIPDSVDEVVWIAEWHGGLMDEEYIDYIDSEGNRSEIDCVIHMPGSYQSVEWASWNEFKLVTTESAGEDYRGTYKPEGLNTHNDRLLIIALAHELAAYDITYTFLEQIGYNVRENMTKVEPYDVTKFRCDGFIEYCYEYYGYRIYGPDDYWDITVPATLNHLYHVANGTTPREQALLYMSVVTTNESDMLDN